MSDSSARAELVKKLNAEGDYAADYLEELLDIADLDGDIEISVESDRAAVAVVTDGTVDRRLKRLIGDNGEVLDSLQELARLAVQAKTGERSRLMLDIAGHRAAHREEIAAIAQEAIAAVFASGESVSLKPMNPFERKVVHDFAANAGLVSDSEGIGPARHVIVSLPSEDDQEEGAASKVPSTADSADEVEVDDADGDAALGESGGSDDVDELDAVTDEADAAVAADSSRDTDDAADADANLEASSTSGADAASPVSEDQESAPVNEAAESSELVGDHSAAPTEDGDNDTEDTNDTDAASTTDAAAPDPAPGESN
ncbi:MAG: R3H domain-containing nucleic acid-binding protein [Actinomycetaceae bacterium]|nr:R3H domain-containing nucleic acid-binding protein [Actinomycetaceae bacterium]